MKSYSPKKSQLVDSRHFTLIELLITIAIIAILAAMLLPALNMARDKSKAIKCLSNMKQTLSALYLYADDNAELLPMPYFDKNKLPGYPKSLAWGAVLQASGHLAKNTIAQCPSVKVTKYKDPASGWGETFGLIPGSEGHRFVCIKLSTISSKASPSRFSLVIDTIKPASGEQGYQMLPSWLMYAHLRHGKKANIGFADGSAGAYATDDIESLGDVCSGETSQYNRTKLYKATQKPYGYHLVGDF